MIALAATRRNQLRLERSEKGSPTNEEVLARHVCHHKQAVTYVRSDRTQASKDLQGTWEKSLSPAAANVSVAAGGAAAVPASPSGQSMTCEGVDMVRSY